MSQLNAEQSAQSKPQILIVSSSSASDEMFDTLTRKLSGQGRLDIQHCKTWDEAEKVLQSEPVAVCLMNITLTPADRNRIGTLFSQARHHRDATQFILKCEAEHSELQSVTQNPQVTVLPASADSEHLLMAIEFAIQQFHLKQHLNQIQRQLCNWVFRDLVGSSPVMQQLRERILELSRSQDHLVIFGEPGSGVSLCALAVHSLDRDSSQECLSVDCRIFTAELFKHELTSAIPGLGTPLRIFHEPESQNIKTHEIRPVTLILDHLEEASLSLQDEIISVLNQSDSSIRMIACTHADLRTLAQAGQFRDGLIHRLGNTSLEVPSLRERKDDLQSLTTHLLQTISASLGTQPPQLTSDALHCLQKYNWPGNVRELHYVLKNICSSAQSDPLTQEDILLWLHSPDESSSLDTRYDFSLKSMERKLIESTFARCRGNREQTAKSLKIGLRTLSGKLREYGYPPRGGPGSNVRPHSRKAA
ncbi:MAG: nitrogen regulation protein NR(I) [Planctomycetaceae bacterium]